ncbi:unnamed protein product [marine sediment metagenome]|uniref:Uncharacterized protein n=1 Tax=marine sediment metagenome TaxID=412755 RepID=X1KRL1_9ZZZZ
MVSKGYGAARATKDKATIAALDKSGCAAPIEEKDYLFILG